MCKEDKRKKLKCARSIQQGQCVVIKNRVKIYVQKVQAILNWRNKHTALLHRFSKYSRNLLNNNKKVH